jgi:hypothetical protein
MTRTRAWAFSLAWLAILVNGPRYVLAYLRVDSVRLDPRAEGALLFLTGAATAIVLTGGNIVLASMIARCDRFGTKLLLGVAWGLQLVFAIVLISPLLVLGVKQSSLDVVLPGAWGWVWALTAVGAVEVIAGATMGGFVATRPRSSSKQVEQGNRWGNLLYQAAYERFGGIEQPLLEKEESRKEAGKWVCPYCGRVDFDTAFAWGGHKSHCSQKPVGGTKNGRP